MQVISEEGVSFKVSLLSCCLSSSALLSDVSLSLFIFLLFLPVMWFFDESVCDYVCFPQSFLIDSLSAGLLWFLMMKETNIITSSVEYH